MFFRQEDMKTCLLYLFSNKSCSRFENKRIFVVYSFVIEKNHTFVLSILYRKPQWAEVGQTYIHIRRNCTLWFWHSENFATSSVRQKQSNGNASWGVLYTAIIGFGRFYRSLLMWFTIYLHLRGAFGVVSALYIARWYFLFVTYLIISRYTIMQT